MCSVSEAKEEEVLQQLGSDDIAIWQWWGGETQQDGNGKAASGGGKVSNQWGRDDKEEKEELEEVREREEESV